VRGHQRYGQRKSRKEMKRVCVWMVRMMKGENQRILVSTKWKTKKRHKLGHGIVSKDSDEWLSETPR